VLKKRKPTGKPSQQAREEEKILIRPLPGGLMRAIISTYL